ncbi:unnamed protein product [Euphydryas editha]|uniref:Aminopeptidase N n=1 Tax=Euphydryas editha TaxID=104508 RepID=A0AAU9V2A6_EUPED|nr:unnamed protein product [Euphydryas editha]
MLSLIFLSLLGSAFSGPVDFQYANVTDYQHYRLNDDVTPSFYDVRLFFDPNSASGFNGDVSMRLIVNNNTSRILLHAMAMQIQSVQLFADGSQTNLATNYTLSTDETHFLEIVSSVNLTVGSLYVLNIAYVGTYATNMFGVYISTYQYMGQTQNLIASQLQPTFARRAFPCFDEPRFKAIFRTTIYAPAQYPTVRSNMPIRATPLKPEVQGYVKHEFEDTPIMSSYLLAYLVSNFTYVSNEGQQNASYRIPFRIYSRPGTEDTAQFALDFGQRNMVALETYTNITYDLPKFDKAAIPDFAAGAMENWGLVLYRYVKFWNVF